jgi:hypothetical protein
MDACVFDFNGSRLVMFVNDGGTPPGGRLQIYDSGGAQVQVRCDCAADAQSVLWEGDRVLIAGAYRNGIVWVDGSGRVLKEWLAPGEVDSWHLSGLFEHEGRLYASAFGRFSRYREWSGEVGSGMGAVFDVGTGEDVLSGLCCPHNPRFFDGRWFICNSHRGEVLQVDPGTREVTRRAGLSGFPRGVALSEDRLYIGVSVNRYLPSVRHNASVAVLRRDTWEVEESFELPFSEICDLALVPHQLVGGLKHGFGPSQGESSSLRSEPLPEDECRVRLEVEIPPVLEPDCTIEVSYRLRNLGARQLISSPPHPVHLSYCWAGAENREEGLRSSLPRPLAPLDEVRGRMLVRTPKTAGVFTLRISAVQEGVRWFDHANDGNAWSREIRIREA